MKVLFGMALRQTTGFVDSLLRLGGLDWTRTLSAVSCGCACRAAEGEGEWNARKHGGPKRRLWRKIHIGINEETLEIRTTEGTSSSIRDAPTLPDLLNQIPSDQELGCVTAPSRQIASQSPTGQWMVLTTRASAMMRLGPETAIQSVSQAKMPNCGSRTRQEHERATKLCDPQRIWALLCGDGGADTTAGVALRQLSRNNAMHNPAGQRMHCKKLLGQRLSARDFDRQVA